MVSPGILLESSKISDATITYHQSAVKTGVHTFFISTSNFHLNMVVLNHFPKLRLKWFLAGALLELVVNCPKMLSFFEQLLNPTNQNIIIIIIIPKLDQDDD